MSSSSSEEMEMIVFWFVVFIGGGLLGFVDLEGLFSFVLIGEEYLIIAVDVLVFGVEGVGFFGICQFISFSII